MLICLNPSASRILPVRTGLFWLGAASLLQWDPPLQPFAVNIDWINNVRCGGVVDRVWDQIGPTRLLELDSNLIPNRDRIFPVCMRGIIANIMPRKGVLWLEKHVGPVRDPKSEARVGRRVARRKGSDEKTLPIKLKPPALLVNVRFLHAVHASGVVR